MTITVRVEGRALDFFQDDPIEITRSVRQLADLNAIYSEFTKEFSIPATDLNNEILRHWYDLSIVNSINAARAINGTLEIADQANETLCTIELTGVDITNGEPSQYSIVVYGTTRKVADDFGNKTLQQINLSVFNHSFNLTALTDSWAGNLLGGAILYPLFDFVTGWIHQPTGTLNVTQNIAKTGGAIDLIDLRPSILLRELFIACFADIGLTVSGAWLTDTRLNNLFVLGMEKEGRYREAVYDGLFSVSNSIRITIEDLSLNYVKVIPYDIINYDPFGVVDLPNQQYLASITGAYKFEIVFVVYDQQALSGSPASAVDIDLLVNGNPYGDTKTTLLVNGNIYAFTFEANLLAGDLVWWGVFGSAFQNYLVLEPLSVWRAVKTPQGTSLNVSMAETMPDIPATEFIQGCVNAFNLVFIPKTVNEIEVTFLDEFYNAGAVIDITPYVNTEQYSFKKNDLLRSATFAHAQGEDVANEQFMAANNRMFGSAEYQSQADFAKEDLGIDTVFSVPIPDAVQRYDNLNQPTLLSQLETVKVYGEGDTIEPVQLPLILFYYAGLQPVTDTYYIRTSFNTAGTVLKNVWPYCRPYAERPSDSDTLSLAFGTEGVLDAGFEDAPLQGLIAEYWANYLANAFNENGRLLTVEVVAPFNLLRIDALNAKIVYNSQTFIIQEITYSTATQRYQLVLARYQFIGNPATIITNGNDITFFEAEPNAATLKLNHAYPSDGGYVIHSPRGTTRPTPPLFPLGWVAYNNTLQAYNLATPKEVLNVPTVIYNANTTATYAALAVTIVNTETYRVKVTALIRNTVAARTSRYTLFVNGISTGIFTQVQGNNFLQVSLEWIGEIQAGQTVTVRAESIGASANAEISFMEMIVQKA